MKNLNILQTGGRVYYSSVANPSSNAAVADRLQAASSSSSKEDNGLLPKALMEKLSEKGIPTDVNKFMDMLASFERRADFGMGVDKRQLYRLLAYANQIIKLSEYLDAAEKRAEENGALDEFAVDARGYLYVPDENGTISKVHASQFDASNLRALTVGELLQERKFNNLLVADSTIATAVGNNIGIEKINDYILGILKAVGSTDDASEAYVNLGSIVGKQARKPDATQMAALQELYLLTQLLGPDAIFKVKDQYKTKNMEAAMSYIMSMLPNNIKTQLIARNVAAGGKYENSTKYAANIIGMAAEAGNDSRIAHSMDYEASINKAAGNGADSDLNRNLGVLEQLVLGSLGKRDYKLINRKNPEYSLNLHGSGVGSMATFNNHIVDKSPISIVLLAGLAPLVDEEHITIGNLKLPLGYLDTVLYNGGDIINVWAPTNANGDVDLEGLSLLSEILNICETNPQLTTEDKNNLLKKYSLDGYFDDRGTFHGTGNMAQFLVMTGVTSDEIIDPDLNPFADKLSSKEKEAELSLIDRIYGDLNKGVKAGKYEFKKGWFDFTTYLYRAPIFMRLNKTAQIDAGTFSGKGPIVKTPTYKEQLAYDLIHNNTSARQLIIPSTSVL